MHGSHLSLCHKEPARSKQNTPLGVFGVSKPLVGGFGCDELVLYGIRDTGVATLSTNEGGPHCLVAVAVQGGPEEEGLHAGEGNHAAVHRGHHVVISHLQVEVRCLESQAKAELLVTLGFILWH